ncbi:hypothetical protein O181_053350 [Austropuccinia psidii MF-1]|uniref:Uncharacterized protein n=1 Tax=Austropuccinia psidii MF-1 TaxID=1389203 RepID=A0A9Q3E6N9_9BASI|nr:hypothetical protein [Austropuccinia psidii MF-1]
MPKPLHQLEFSQYKANCQSKTKSPSNHMPTSYQSSISPSKFNSSGTPTSNPSQQAFTLSLCSRADHSRWGYCHNHGKNPPILVHGISILTQFMANWPLVVLNGLWATPRIPSQFSTSPNNWPIPLILGALAHPHGFGGSGLNGLFGIFRPPTALRPAVCRPHTMGLFRPLLA